MGVYVNLCAFASRCVLVWVPMREHFIIDKVYYMGIESEKREWVLDGEQNQHSTTTAAATVTTPT